MAGLPFSKLYESWSTLLPKGAVVMARRPTEETAADETGAATAVTRFPVVVAKEFHDSPFLVRMLGSIGLQPDEYDVVEPAQMKSISSASVPALVVFSQPGLEIPSGSQVFVLPGLAQIQADAVAKRQAWEELKRLAKLLGKAVASR